MCEFPIFFGSHPHVREYYWGRIISLFFKMAYGQKSFLIDVSLYRITLGDNTIPNISSLPVALLAITSDCFKNSAFLQLVASHNASRSTLMHLEIPLRSYLLSSPAPEVKNKLGFSLVINVLNRLHDGTCINWSSLNHLIDRCMNKEKWCSNNIVHGKPTLASAT